MADSFDNEKPGQDLSSSDIADKQEKCLYSFVSDLRKEIDQLRNENKLLFIATSHELNGLRAENIALKKLIIKLTTDTDIMDIKIDDFKQKIQYLEMLYMFKQDEKLASDEEERQGGNSLLEAKDLVGKAYRLNKRARRIRKDKTPKKSMKIVKNSNLTSITPPLKRKRGRPAKIRPESTPTNNTMSNYTSTKISDTKSTHGKGKNIQDKNTINKGVLGTDAEEIQATHEIAQPQTEPYLLKAKRPSKMNPVVFISNKKRM